MEEAWKRFTQTGMVQDYLVYASLRKNETDTTKNRVGSQVCNDTQTKHLSSDLQDGLQMLR